MHRITQCIPATLCARKKRKKMQENQQANSFLRVYLSDANESLTPKPHKYKRDRLIDPRIDNNVTIE